MAIVTISHEMGSGGAELGMALASYLSYRHVDHEVILDRARTYGLAEARLAHLEEDKPSLFERFDTETRRYIMVIQTVLYELAAEDGVVLIGRGGQWLLRGIPHVLRVRVIAPFELRVQRLTETLSARGSERVSPRTAAQMVRRDDGQKTGRMRYLYDVELHDPGLYDVTINLGVLSQGVAVSLLADLVRCPEFAPSEAGRQLVADRALTSRVEVALATYPETRNHRIRIDAKHGLVTLELTSAVDPDVVTTVARDIWGVREVKIRQVDVPPVPPFIV
jgi:cytidylate kinase